MAKKEKIIGSSAISTILTALKNVFVKKNEIIVTDGTGEDADKVTIQLKPGTSVTVLKSINGSLMTEEEFDDLYYSVFEDDN